MLSFIYSPMLHKADVFYSARAAVSNGDEPKMSDLLIPILLRTPAEKHRRVFHLVIHTSPLPRRWTQ